MDQVLGALFLALFLGHFAFLFYADAKMKRVARHLDFPWYQHYKRFSWLKENLDTFEGEDLDNARKAIRGRNLSLACVVLMLLWAVSSVAQQNPEPDDRAEGIIEGTRSLEGVYSEKYCGKGSLVACLQVAGLTCNKSDHSMAGMICSMNGRPVYRLTPDPMDIVQHHGPTEWVVESIDDMPERPVSARLIEVGTVPRPPRHAGRDVGFSGVLQGRSVWVFGDTFLPKKGDDGLQWRSTSWSWTSDLSGEDGIGEFEHALGSDGMARQLLPHTEEEHAFNIAHEGHENCAAGSDCGARRTPWPQALVIGPSGQRGILYYANMQTGTGGQWDFGTVSGSVATWDDPESPATRIEPPLFADEEPDWGAAAVLVDGDVFVYACEFDGKRKPCLLAKVPFNEATVRESYRFWAGNESWSDDWRDAVAVFDGGSLFSVHFNKYLGQYVTFYTPGLFGSFSMRTADSLEGPWSEPVSIGQGVKSAENWNYALIAHPEFAREDGRIEVLSYTHPAGFLTQETRLVEVHFD